MEGSPSQQTSRLRQVSEAQLSPAVRESDVCQQIERAFLHEVERAEELAKLIEPGMSMMVDIFLYIF